MTILTTIARESIFSRVEYSLDYFRRDQIPAEIAEGVEINEGERKSKAKRAGNKKSEL